MARKSIKLDDFDGIKVKVKMDKIIGENAKEATETLHSINDWKTHRRTKSYSAGWTYEIYSTDEKDIYAKVFNKTNWQLTWLLEKGHLIVNKKGGVGWAAPRRHIEPTYDKQARKFIKDMKSVDLEIDFE